MSSCTWAIQPPRNQRKRGEQHIHVGIVHAPNAEMALLFGKEQFGRRGLSVNIWVVRTRDVSSTGYDDSDIFETVPEKQYREAGGYKVRDKINAYRKKQKSDNNDKNS